MIEDKTINISEEDIIWCGEIFFAYYICPNCKDQWIKDNDKYCSNCGCKIKWEIKQ